MAHAKPIDVVLPVACGVDVHKRFIVAVLCDATDPLHPVYHKKRFSTFTCSLREFRDWLLSYDCRHVCMESTGQYWRPVFNILELAMEFGLSGKTERKGLEDESFFFRAI
ncbi:hypothetical protein [uncultured Dubosiella sp.]|uniref:hypothetical protein n=1 Tax=uncultured Dubosiella sp. TaxID=1937011 RepID=UPI00272F583D|nr:hypothetical protein [uncultured Dubosiella sp.]